MEKNSQIPAEQFLRQFAIDGELAGVEPYGQGHINLTFRSEWKEAGTKKRYIHQRINEKVFTRPNKVMENIDLVTSHIRKKAGMAGITDLGRCTLTIVPSKDGKLWARDNEGSWWRTFLFIEDSHSLEITATPEDARILGKSIACFQSQTADLDPERLHETIPGFHDMEKRYKYFNEVISGDSHDRVKDVRAEIGFMLENEERGDVLIRALRNRIIPVRTCHNDAKINNILIDDASSKVLCVIDLDTVMPGTVLFDLGDLIRTVCATAAEDEKDLSRVDFNVDYFEALLSGYLSGAGNFLVPSELALLCEAGRNITQIMGLRFLSDYLDGDQYYRVSYPLHNLDRCRTQIALINSMDSKWQDIMMISEKIRKKYISKKN